MAQEPTPQEVNFAAAKQSAQDNAPIDEANRSVGVADEAATTAPVVEAPVVEAPVVEAPVVEAPVVEAPVVEAPATNVTETPSVE